jgi:hypothetical protein
MLEINAALKIGRALAMKDTKKIMINTMVKNEIKLLVHNNVLQTYFATDGIQVIKQMKSASVPSRLKYRIIYLFKQVSHSWRGSINIPSVRVH